MTFAFIYISKRYSSLLARGSGDPGGRSAGAQTAAPSASLWFSSSCQIMELESGTFSASGIPEPVTATLAGPGSWTRAHETIKTMKRKGRKVEYDIKLCHVLFAYRVRSITWEVVGSTLRFFFWFCLLVRGYTTSCSLHLETDGRVF